MYVGIENSSTALNVAVLDEDETVVDTISIDRLRFREDERTILDRLGEVVDLDDVQMVSLGFAWGDDLGAIRDIEAVDGRGLRGTPGFMKKPTDAEIFDELESSELPCVLIPGVNDKLECLHPYFRHYAQLSGPDKVAEARYAVDHARDAGDAGETVLTVNVSSTVRAAVVSDGRLSGAFHWQGPLHGWGDGDILEGILSGEIDPMVVLLRSGLLYKPGSDFGTWPESGGAEDDRRTRREQIRGDLEGIADDPEILERLYWAALHDVYSLLPFANHDGETPLERITITGRLGRVEEPFDLGGELQSALEAVAPTDRAPAFSTAMGAALLSKDVATGRSETLGIPIEAPPARSTEH